MGSFWAGVKSAGIFVDLFYVGQLFFFGIFSFRRSVPRSCQSCLLSGSVRAVVLLLFGTVFNGTLISRIWTASGQT